LISHMKELEGGALDKRRRIIIVYHEALISRYDVG